MAQYSVHYNLVHATADGHQVVYHPTGVGRCLASVERILCPDSKRLLHQGHGMAASENIAAGTDGCDRQFGGAIASSKSDAVSFQYVRGSQPPMAKSVMEGRASNMIIQRPASLQNPCHIKARDESSFSNVNVLKKQVYCTEDCEVFGKYMYIEPTAAVPRDTRGKQSKQFQKKKKNHSCCKSLSSATI